MRSAPLRLGVLGGTLDPVHVGHVAAAHAAARALSLDTVWLLPSHVPAHKAAPHASPWHRFAMASLAASEDDLLRRTTGGIRIGSIENLRCLPGPGLPFRGVARSVRRIGEGGRLEAALPPLIWTGKVLDLLAAVDGAARERALWIPATHRSPAVAPALRLSAVGDLSPSREVRG